MAELIVIGIDNSRSIRRWSDIFKFQCDAVKFYCQAKFEENPDTIVGLFKMSSFDSGHLLYPPTGSLEEIDAKLQSIYSGSGDLNVKRTLSFGALPLVEPLNSQYKKKRMVLFVGGLTDLSSGCAESFGETYKDRGIAVDVIYFCQSKPPKDGMFDYRWGWSELVEFVNICNGNDNDNSHIVRVGPESSIRDAVSKSIFKKTPSKNKNANVKRRVGEESSAAAARGTKYGQHVTLSKGKTAVARCMHAA